MKSAIDFVQRSCTFVNICAQLLETHGYRYMDSVFCDEVAQKFGLSVSV